MRGKISYDKVFHKKEAMEETNSIQTEDIYDYFSLDNFYDNDEIDFVELMFLKGYNMAL